MVARFYMLTGLKMDMATLNSENFAKSVKRHICDVKISRTWHDLPISNERVMSPIREGSIFTKLRIYLGGRLGALIRGPFRQVFQK